jgi:hypothetical protein
MYFELLNVAVDCQDAAIKTAQLLSDACSCCVHAKITLSHDDLQQEIARGVSSNGALIFPYHDLVLAFF